MTNEERQRHIDRLRFIYNHLEVGVPATTFLLCLEALTAAIAALEREGQITAWVKKCIQWLSVDHGGLTPDETTMLLDEGKKLRRCPRADTTQPVDWDKAAKSFRRIIGERGEEIIKMANGTQHTDWTTTAVSNDSSHAPMPVCDHDDCGPTECRRKAQHTDPQPSTDLESVREELATVSGKYGEAVQEIVRLRLEIGELKAAITKAAEERLQRD